MPEGRVIRVFVSSTFRDMRAERDELVKRVFPELRRRCESRGVTWGEVDLRWGITDEQRAEGLVLPLCLAEIRNCRPYFIALLGERYGWVPDALPEDLTSREPWLSERQGRSVTELEILHGVLNDPAMAGHAFFYFRDPAYLETLLPGDRPAFLEAPTADEIVRFGGDEASRRAESRRRQLRDLKTRIRASGLPVRESYPTPRALGDLVLADLGAVIDGLYPEGSTPDPLDREALGQEAFIRSRARVYVGRPGDDSRLDAHAAGDGPPLVVTGDSGVGKSALLANWVRRYRSANAGVPVLAHFIGATAESVDWAAMLRRLLGELERQASVRVDPGPDAAGLRRAFTAAVNLAGATGRLVLVIDGLNQLEDRDGALDLAWLSRAIPAGVRLVLSTLAGRPRDELGRRGWPTMTVEPLSLPERRRLIAEYLGLYRKVLSEGRIEAIAAVPQAASPIYLRALLEELRLWGEHETLDTRIAQFLAARTAAQLYDLILARWEQDYERDRPGLVRHAMSLLWAARRGLSQAELLDLLGGRGEPLPGAFWSPLGLAAGDALLDRGGPLGFSHEFVRAAVGDRYLATEPARRAAHAAIADYFEARESGARRTEELPWQLASAGAWGRLRALLADLDFTDLVWKAGRYDLHRYWAALERQAHRLTDGYRDLLQNPRDRPYTAFIVVRSLLDEAGYSAEAMGLTRAWVAEAETWGNPLLFGHALNQLGQAHAGAGELERALDLHDRADAVYRDAGDQRGLAESRCYRAGVLYRMGDPKAADRLFAEAEASLRADRSDPVNLAVMLHNRAVIRESSGDLVGAAELSIEAERIKREVADDVGLAGEMVFQAGLLWHMQRRPGAIAKLEAAEQMYRAMGSRAGLAECAKQRADFLKDQRDLAGALAALQDVEATYRELSQPAAVASAVFNQGLLLASGGTTRSEGIARLEAAERLYSDLGLTAEATQARLWAFKVRAGYAVGPGRAIGGVAFTLIVAALVAGSVAWSPWLWLLAGPVALLWAHSWLVFIPAYRRRLMGLAGRMAVDLRLEDRERRRR